MDNLIYDFKVHGLYYEIQDTVIPTFSLAIDTLELVFELHTKKLIQVQGFLPLVNASICNIDLPKCKEGDYILRNADPLSYNQNEVYDFIQKVPHEKKYFGNTTVKYDKVKGVIQIGAATKGHGNIIKINNNILCGLDQNLDLECIYIIPTKFIQ